MTRTGRAAGRAIEDLGVAGDELYEMTHNDLTNSTTSNADLAEFCGTLLSQT